MLGEAGGDLSGGGAASDPARARDLGRKLNLRPLTAQLLLNRRMGELPDALRFLQPRLADLRPPDGGAAGAGRAMAGFQRAAERLVRAVLDGETVGVFGDYDVDGLTTCALTTRFLRDLGGRVVARVARRDAGYGFGVADAEAFADGGCAAIVTCDCGTSDREALAHARARGCDTIVVDHHQVPDGETGAYVLLNPHQPGCGFPFKGLASVGVGFYLAAAVRTLLRARRPSLPLPDPRELLDLVAVGTICDLAPLTDENRVLVATGLRELSRGRRPGLRALVELCGLDLDRAPSAFDVGFKIGPRLNAPGRLGDAQLGLDLLLAPDAAQAIALGYACEEVNARRRVVQDQALGEALGQLEAAPPSARAVVVAGPWPPGVMGIVAAKLVERSGLPSLAIALAGEEGRGSARSAGGVDLYRALAACSAHLIRFGGHAGAAGVTVAAAEVAPLAAAFERAVREQAGAAPDRSPGCGVGSRPQLPVEAEVDLDQVDERLADELACLAPFGIGNPEPLLAARGVVDRSRVVGERHLQLTVRRGAHACDGIAFGFAERDPGAGARVRIAFVPEVDTFRGTRRLRLRVRDLRSDGEP